MKMSCLVLGTLCICYYLLIVSYAGIKAAFSPIWLVLAIGFYFLMAVIRLEQRHMITIPSFMKIIFVSAVLVGSIIFLIVEGIIVKNGVADPKPNADYMIILGAKVNGTVPSKTLRARVYGTKEYLEKNKNTKVIVSGGQGNGEDVTEAFAMKKLLINMGISENRIYMEEKSTNTEENIRFSKAMIEEQVKKKPYEVVIATSDFHIYRGISLAKKQGITNVSGCPSKPDKILMVHYYFREFFAVVKDKLVGNI